MMGSFPDSQAQICFVVLDREASGGVEPALY